MDKTLRLAGNEEKMSHEMYDKISLKIIKICKKKDYQGINQGKKNNIAIATMASLLSSLIVKLANPGQVHLLKEDIFDYIGKQINKLENE